MDRAELAAAVRQVRSREQATVLLDAVGRARQGLAEPAPDPQLSASLQKLVLSDEVTRSNLVGELLNRHFPGEPCDDLLRTLGLYSAAKGPATEWDLEPGDIARRQVIHNRFGGQKQGGISTPANTKRVLLFADSTASLYGYDDGWKTDGSYHYTGQGRVGDQRLTAANQAVRELGSEIHVFEEAARTVVRYLGQFKPDSTEPYYRVDAPDVTGDLRSAIVFRLWPVDDVPQPTQPTPVAVQTTSVEVPLEAHNVTSFAANPAKGPTTAERREATLVQRYTDWLSNQGIPTVRNEIPIAGQSRPLRTDLFNKHTRELIEAKGAATRDNIRLALGQILDYARYVPHNSLAILLPVRPAQDLITLLTDHGINCIYESPPNNFERTGPLR